MARASKMVLLLALVFAAASLQSSRAEDYDVGGDFEWRVPTNDPNFYSKWASNITFLVGDTLEFEFTTGAHDVATVTKAAYDACTTANPISLRTTGPATIRLNTTGEHYFICTISDHCSNGQKLAINVTGTTSSPPSTGTTPSPPGTSGTPSAPTPTSNTSAPPPPSSASSLTATIFLVFTSVAVAFLC